MPLGYGCLTAAGSWVFGPLVSRNQEGLNCLSPRRSTILEVSASVGVPGEGLHHEVGRRVHRGGPDERYSRIACMIGRKREALTRYNIRVRATSHTRLSHDPRISAMA